MKLKIKEVNGRKRFQHATVGESLTDQSFKKSCCINNIMKLYAKTGQLPHFQTREAIFADISNAPESLTEAFETVQDAKELFLLLPSEIRKMINHDPSQLVEFLSNEKNEQILLEHGLIEKKINYAEPAENQNKSNDSNKLESKDSSASA